MSSAIIDGTNIDLSVFSYSAPKPNATGGKVVNLYNKHSKESLIIAAPLMSSWGAQEIKEVIGKGADGKAITRGTGKYTISLQFSKGEYTTPDADKFLDQLKRVEHKIKEDAMVYSKEWFGKEIKSMEVIDEKFNSMLKYPKFKGTEIRNYEEPPSLTVKLPCWKNVWQTSVFDEDYEILYSKNTQGVTPLDYLVNTAKSPIQVVALIQSGGLWFINGKVSIVWNLKQVVVRKPKTSSISDDVCYLNIKQSDLNAIKSLPQPEIDMADNIPATVEDSDDERPLMPQPQISHVEEPKEVVVAETPAENASVPAGKKKVLKKKQDATAA